MFNVDPDLFGTGIKTGEETVNAIKSAKSAASDARSFPIEYNYESQVSALCDAIDSLDESNLSQKISTAENTVLALYQYDPMFMRSYNSAYAAAGNTIIEIDYSDSTITDLSLSTLQSQVTSEVAKDSMQMVRDYINRGIPVDENGNYDSKSDNRRPLTEEEKKLYQELLDKWRTIYSQSEDTIQTNLYNTELIDAYARKEENNGFWHPVLEDAADDQIFVLSDKLGIATEEMKEYYNMSIGGKIDHHAKAFISGGIEGVVNVGEAIVDGGATLAGFIWSIGGDTSGFEKFIKFDAGASVYDYMTSDINEIIAAGPARKYGNFVGEIAGYAAIDILTGGWGTVTAHTLRATGAATEKNLIAGHDFDTSVKAGVLSGAVELGARGIREVIKTDTLKSVLSDSTRKTIKYSSVAAAEYAKEGVNVYVTGGDLGDYDIGAATWNAAVATTGAILADKATASDYIKSKQDARKAAKEEKIKIKNQEKIDTNPESIIDEADEIANAVKGNLPDASDQTALSDIVYGRVDQWKINMHGRDMSKIVDRTIKNTSKKALNTGKDLIMSDSLE